MLAPALLKLLNLLGHGAQGRQAPAYGQNLRDYDQQGHRAEAPCQNAPEVADDGEGRALVNGDLKNELGFVRVVPDRHVGEQKERLAAGLRLGEKEAPQHGFRRRQFHIVG